MADRPEYLVAFEPRAALPKRRHVLRNVVGVCLLLGALAAGAWWTWYEKVQPFVDGLFGDGSPTATAAVDPAARFREALKAWPAILHRQHWYLEGKVDFLFPETAVDPSRIDEMWKLALGTPDIAIPLPATLPPVTPEPIQGKPAPVFGDAIADDSERTSVTRWLAVPKDAERDEAYAWAERNVVAAPERRAFLLDGRIARFPENDALYVGLGIAHAVAAATGHAVEVRVVGRGYDHAILAGPAERVKPFAEAHRAKIRAWVESRSNTEATLAR